MTEDPKGIASPGDPDAERDLAHHSAERGPSLLDVAATNVADRLSRATSATRPQPAQWSVVTLVLIGVAAGVGLGLLLLFW